MAFLPVRFSASETVISIFFAKQSSIFWEEENKDSCNINHTRQRLLTLPPLLLHHICSNKTSLCGIKALTGLCFIPMFCITFASENWKLPLGRKQKSQQTDNFRYQKPPRARRIQKREIFFFTGNKVTFFLKTNTLTPVFSIQTLPSHQWIPLQDTRDTCSHLSPFTGNRIYPDQDVFLLISQRRIVIFYTGRQKSVRTTRPPWKGRAALSREGKSLVKLRAEGETKT